MRNGQELERLVCRAQTGDMDAYDQIVRRFQDRAVGYAFSLLGDFDLAQDAAQEAFIEAYRDLPDLRAPAAFAGWLRKIIYKRCDRPTRRKRLPSLPLELGAQIASRQNDPVEAAVKHERRQAVRAAVRSLPPGECEVTTLFYLGGCSHAEIAEFLGLPVTTVKSRLHTSRRRLKERMVSIMKEGLEAERPSRATEFVGRVNADIARALAEVRAGDMREMEIRHFHPQARYRDPHPVFDLTVSILRWAIESGAAEIHLVTDATGMHVMFLVAEGLRQVMTLPFEMRGPVTERQKDLAGLDILAQSAQQQGSFPAVMDGRNYEVRITCTPANAGETLVLQIVSKPDECR